MIDEKIKKLVDKAFDRSETYFIFEGVDKAGKTTLLKQIKNYIKKKNKPALVKVISNPTLSQKQELKKVWAVVDNAVTNAVLYSTYIDHTMQRIWQAVDLEIANKENIPIIYLIDRWYISTLAYQKAQAISREQVWAIEEIVDDKINNFLLATFDSFNPDNSVVNILYLDTPISIVRSRLIQERKLSKYEDIEFLRKVKKFYEEELNIHNNASEDYPHLRVHILRLDKIDNDKWVQVDWAGIMLNVSFDSIAGWK